MLAGPCYAGRAMLYWQVHAMLAGPCYAGRAISQGGVGTPPGLGGSAEREASTRELP